MTAKSINGGTHAGFVAEGPVRVEAGAGVGMVGAELAPFGPEFVVTGDGRSNAGIGGGVGDQGRKSGGGGPQYDLWQSYAGCQVQCLDHFK